MIGAYDSIHFAIFTMAPSPKSALVLWGEVMETDPTGFQTQPMGLSQCSGSWGSVTVNLQVHPTRVDLILVPPDPVAPFQASPPRIENAEEAIKYGLKCAKKVAEHLKVSRVATVLQSSADFQTAEEAVATVKQTLDTLPMPANATELNYQVIVPLMSKVQDGMAIQRLCRWHTGKKLLLQIDPNNPVTVSSGVPIAGSYIDVFTPLGEVIAPANVGPIFDEIAAECQRVLETGYAAIA